MSLEDYESKRNLGSSGEPPARLQFSDGDLFFVIHKHAASHLHFDLRLEYENTLKSWAVPKGPSLNPSDKRLAIMVEDHPLEYRNFEGVIPKGNYGAGTVMIWDEGTYYIPDANSKTESEQLFKQFINKGHVSFYLEGRKLKGLFDLVKLKRASIPNGWLLIKKHDQYTRTEPVFNDLDRSARSCRTMSQIGLSNSVLTDFPTNHNSLSPKPKNSFHIEPVHPMLAQLTEAPFDNENWIFEIKWDGYRAIADNRNDSLRFYSRNGNSFIDKYTSVVENLKMLDFQAVFDGELVAVDKDGKASFNLLQNYHRRKKGTLLYYIFDLLYYEGCDLRSDPLIQRKALLKQVLPALNHLRYNDHIEKTGVAFYDLARENQLEGIIAKEKNSPYLEGVRSDYWKKIKITMQQEFVIGGFSAPKGGRTGFGSLLLGIYQDDKLIYAGSVGTGFSNDDLPIIRNLLEKICISNNPFSNMGSFNNQATWVNPLLVCEVKFAEWTQDGFLRQPVFLGLREDINPKQVHREYRFTPHSSKLHIPTGSSKDTLVEINGKNLRLTNLNKIYFPDDNITKGDIISYYRNISGIILPYLKNRPESLHRFPDGINGKNFFHKNIDDAPEWVPSVKIESDQGTIRYILCQDEASLSYIINLGAIEINPWSSQIGSLDFPDYMVIDLDPLECPFQYVVDTALFIHDILQNLEMPHFIKTSGATGLHLYVPVGGRYSFEQVRQFSFIICKIINDRSPSVTSLERIPQKRKGKVYLDYLQNSKGKTMAAPYSIRPLKGAPVSAPLLWEELGSELRPDQFNINSIFARLRDCGDLWKLTIGKGIDMLAYLDSLAIFFN